MDTVHRVGASKNMDNGENVLTRKEIRRQKLMEYLAAKANLTLPSQKPNMGKDEVLKSDKSAVKVVNDKENKNPTLNRNIKDKPFQSTYSVKRPLGLKNTGNINCSKPCEKQNSKNRSTVNTEPKTQIPVFTRTYTVVNPKPKLRAASQKPSANTQVVRQATKAANNTTSICTNATSVKNTINGRMIHGPIIKTRTGLMPAVIQPRNLKSHIFTTANDSTTSTNKAQSSTTVASHRPTSQTSNRSRKTMSAVALKPANAGTAAMTERGRNRPQSKCPTASLDKHRKQTRNDKLSDRPHLSARCTSKSVKPDTKARTTQTNGTDSHFRAQAEIKNKPFQGKSANTMTSTRDNFKAKKMVTACSRGGKFTVSEETQKKITAPSKPICAPVVPKQRKKPLVSQTAPQPPRTLSYTNKPTDMKTPRGRTPPQTVQNTLTAAQERIKKLQEWREAKGISYKRPPMFVKTQARRTVAVPQPFWSNMEQEDEAHSLICAVDRSLADCIKLLGEGCPTHQVKEVLSRLPEVSQKFAKYWIFQARLMEREGNLNVLPMFEKAVGLVLEPVDELRTVVFEILKKRDENKDDDKEAEETADATETSPETLNDPVMTPKPNRALICAEKGDSSVVKYKITATPGGPPSQRRESTVVNGQEVRFFTPVRRSVRIERASLRYPVSLQDHDLCVSSYNDLIAEEEKETVRQSECVSVTHTPLYIYRENDALKEKVSVEYVCSDE